MQVKLRCTDRPTVSVTRALQGCASHVTSGNMLDIEGEVTFAPLCVMHTIE